MSSTAGLALPVSQMHQLVTLRNTIRPSNRPALKVFGYNRLKYKFWHFLTLLLILFVLALAFQESAMSINKILLDNLFLF